MALFKEHGTSPFSVILLSLAQFPVIIALYSLFAKGLKQGYAAGLYSFVSAPASLNQMFFGLINLAEPNTIVVALTALVQYFQGMGALPKPENPHALTAAEKMARRNVLIVPVVIAVLFWLYKIPTAVGIYWIVSALFSIGQQRVIQAQQERENHGISGTIRETTH